MSLQLVGTMCKIKPRAALVKPSITGNIGRQASGAAAAAGFYNLTTDKAAGQISGVSGIVSKKINGKPPDKKSIVFLFIPKNYILQSKMYIEPNLLCFTCFLQQWHDKYRFHENTIGIAEEKLQMVAFDDTALMRLEALVSKSRLGTKLPPNEALELKELKLLKSTADINKRRAQITVAKRKIEDREKYRIGGLALAAGLSTWTDEELKNAFASLTARGVKPHTDYAENMSAPDSNDIMGNSTTVSIEDSHADNRLL